MTAAAAAAAAGCGCGGGSGSGSNRICVGSARSINQRRRGRRLDHRAQDECGGASSVRAAIERMGGHVPLCVARSLENCPETEGGATNTNGGRGEPSSSESKYRPRRLSWVSTPSRKSSGGDDSVSSAPTTRRVYGRHPMPSPRLNGYRWTALLLVDISGFTALSTSLDVESLSRTINGYFERLVREVEQGGGDVLKFAGDAFFAAWDGGKFSDCLEDLEDAVLAASRAGAEIVRKFSNFRVAGGGGSGVKAASSSLDVHCGVGAGRIAALHLGDNDDRREFVFLGDPVEQVARAEGAASHGELAASSEALDLLSRTCEMNLPEKEQGLPVVIADRDGAFFVPIESDDDDDDERGEEPRPYRLHCVSPHTMGALRHQMSLYVHPAARRDVARSSADGEADFRSQSVADAELRSVYTIFVKPVIDPAVFGNPAEDDHLFALLNDIMGVALGVLGRYRGHLRQFIVDDKGVVLIATFGQRGASFPNMVTEKGLPATIALFDELKIDLDVDCRIGATFGTAYCGVVGGVRRHEFAILGPSVNLAARLVCSGDNPGILVDDAVRRMASERFTFLSHPPVEAKGYAQRVPIFQPHAAIERRWITSDVFVGRGAEVRQIVRIGKRQLRNPGDMSTCVVLIQSHSGLGKSSLALQAIEKIRRIAGKYNTKLKVMKNVCKDGGEQHIPFCVFRQIILDLINDRGDDGDTDSLSSSGSPLSADGFAPTEEEDRNDSRCKSRLRALCSDLDYTEDFADSICEHMLLLKPERSEEGTDSKKKLSPHDMIDFVADVLLACMSRHDFGLLALDDIQWIDALSWKVVERLVTRGGRLMIICVSRPLADCCATFDTDFLRELRQSKSDNQDAPCFKFTEIHLEPLTVADVRELLAVGFECDAESIDVQVIAHLYDQSGGMPYFVQEIVRAIIEKDLLEWHRDGSLGWRSDLGHAHQNVLHANVNELLLHRLDDFDADARTLLQICAIIGFEFSLSEVLMVQCRGRRGKRRRKERDEILGVLSRADRERILVQSCQGGTMSTELGSEGGKEENTSDMSYSFSHAIWQNCVLGTMLEERKKELHIKVAKALESSLGREDIGAMDLRSAIKLFGHWKQGDDLMRATVLARSIGSYFDSQLLKRQSIDVCLEAVELWKSWQPTGSSDARVAGISEDLLSSISPEQLECLAWLHIDIARRGDTTTTRSFYQKCYSLLSCSSATNALSSRKVYFSLYSGLFILYKNGVIQDSEFTIEDLTKGFVEQAEIHGDPIHIARALAMKGLTMASLGKYEEAIAVQNRLQDVYSAEKLSDGVCREYATDRVAQNFGYSVVWYQLLWRRQEARAQIDFVLQKLMPYMPPKNVHNSIIILFPVIWVLMETGEARKAEYVFLEHVYDRFHEFYGEDSTTFFLCMYKPLRVLLRLAGDAQEGEGYSGKEYADLEAWVLSNKFGSLERYISTTMCPYGKEPHCAFAEICCFLANAQAEVERKGLLMKRGLSLAKISLINTQNNPGYEYARRQSKKVVRMIRSELFDEDNIF